MNSKDLEIIQEIINKYIDPSQNKVFVFGSQATDTARRSSDLDIGIEGSELKPITYFDIKSAFEESDIPYIVDIVDFSKVTDNFQTIAKKKVLPINYKI